MIAVVDYKAGNLRSVLNALGRLGCEALVTADPSVIASADKVILPGVGNDASAMANLRALGLEPVIKSLRHPVLGICVGMQIMCRDSEEGNVSCMGIFDSHVRRFNPADGSKVPHMGWNSIANFDSKAKILSGIKSGDYVYFVHSYYLEAEDEKIVAATTEYGVKIHAAVETGNIFACQFHPEKSSAAGLKILKNFIEL